MRHFFTRGLLAGLLLLTLPGTAVKAQSVPRAEADSLLAVLARSKPDTNRVRLWLRLGEYQVYKPGEFAADMDSARAYAGQAQALSRTLKDYRGEARSLNLLGTVNREARDFPRAIACQRAALQLYRRHGDAGGEAGSYLMLAHALRDGGEAGQARREVQKAIDLYTRNGQLPEAAGAYLEMGNTYANLGRELEEKIAYYRRALDAFGRAGQPKRQADVHKDLGDLYGLQGNAALALIELRKALALYQATGHRALQGVYDLLGDIFAQMGDYQEGLRYGLLAVRTAGEEGDSTLQLCTIYNRVGMMYYRLKQFQKAHAYYVKALRIARKYNDRPSIIPVTGNIAHVLVSLGRTRASLRLLLATAQQYPPQTLTDSIFLASRLLRRYTELGQYATGQRYCNRLLAAARRLGSNDVSQLHVYNAVIPFFLASKQPGPARNYLAGFQRFSLSTQSLGPAANAQLWWFQLDSMRADYPSAIRHYQQYKRLEDSLLNETRSRQIATLDVLHETERKEKDLQLQAQRIGALTRQKQLQEERVKQGELVRNGVAGGAVLLLLLLGVIYNRYRLKRRSNRLLEAQQRQLQAQHEELQAQQDALQAQQHEINRKNEFLQHLLGEKDALLGEKDALLTGQERLLAEKERLLKEIHHRVKNNLQVVMSLLNSQAASLQDQAALSAIQESQHRVQAMALIHQKLYQSEGVARIPMDAYIEEVVAYLSDSYNLSQPIAFHLSVDDIELDVTQAVPLGLIINEAITNAFKYAFPGGRAGNVNLSLHRQAGHAYALAIADDGVGLPAGYDPGQSRSLGMTLLHGFSGQLGGELTLTGPPGLTIGLVFEEEQLVKAYA